MLRMEALLGELWDGEAVVETVARRRPRYVGARIGIYNREGERVGRPGRLSNTEFVYDARRREAADEAPLTPSLLASGVAAEVPAEVVARCAEETS